MLRETIRTYIRKRVSGEEKSDLENDSDVLSLMLKADDVFTEEDIIDELLDFLVAGTMTTQMTTQNTLAHLMTEPTSMSRVRQEFAHLFGSDGLEDIEQVFKSKLTIDSCSDLNFLGYVIQEALRLNPIAPFTSPVSFEKDTKLGNLHVKAGEAILVNVWGLHRNGNYW